MSQIPDPNAVPPAGSVPPPTAAPGTPPLSYATPGEPGVPTKDDQTMALLCYVLGIFTSFIGPLIIWLMKKDTSPFVNDQGKEVLNWEINVIIVCFIFLLVGCIPAIGFIFRLAYYATLVVNLVFCIMGAMEVNKGKAYRFPFSIKIIK